MKVIFFSGDDDSRPILDKLSEKVEVKALVTTPPKPRGRGLKLQPSSLVASAEKKGIKVFTPDNPNHREFCELLKRENADCGILVSYRYIIKGELLNLFPKGFINLHPSLLPKYRGAAPIQRAIMAGERFSGVTVIFMNEMVDAGPIIEQERIEIGEDETFGELKARLFRIGGDCLIKSLEEIVRGEVKPVAQDERRATYASAIKKEELILSWEEGKVDLHNRIRALSPKPGAYTFFRGKRLIILRSKITSLEPGVPGEVIVKDGELFVSAKDGLLRIEELKVAGKVAISGRDFTNGYRPKPGERFH